jgi:hypothetical protein
MIKLSNFILSSFNLQTAYEQNNTIVTNPSEGNINISGTEKVVVDTDLQITSGSPIDGYILTTDALGNTSWQPGGVGSVQGPLVSTNNALVRFDGTTGELLKDSSLVLSDAGILSGSGTLQLSNGSVFQPTYAFSAAPATGMYLSSANRLIITVNTQNRFNFTLNALELVNNDSTPTELRLYEPVSGGFHYTGFKAPLLDSNAIYTLPSSDGGDGYLLQTNGLGQLSWSNTWQDSYQALLIEIDLTQGSLGSAVASDGAWLGFVAPNVELLDTALTFTDALELLDDGYLSLKQEFANYPEANLSSISWSGTPPSSLTNAVYRAIKVNNQVTVWFRARYSVAGTTNTAISFPLPLSLPTPNLWSSHVTGDSITTGTGCVYPNTFPGFNNIAVILSDPGGEFVLDIRTDSVNATGFDVCITYFV